jgi:hypothetical protein
MLGCHEFGQPALDKSRVGYDDVNHALFLGDCCEEAIEISEIGDIAPDRGDMRADRADCFVEFSLTAACNEDISAFLDELLRGRQSDAAAAPVMTATFSSSFLMMFPFFVVSKIRTKFLIDSLAPLASARS